MGHIFISYNHKDAEYARKLANALRGKGFDIWIDAAIEYGSEWPLELQEHLDACEALVVIMTPASYASKWVQNELNRAMRKSKPVFPLLLDGDEPWLSVEATQYTDVRGGKLPSEDFYQLLASEISPTKSTSASTTRAKPVKSFRLPTNSIAIGVAIVVLGLAAFWGGQFLKRAPDPIPTSVPTLTFTPEPTPTAVFTEAAEPTAILISQPETVSELVSPRDGMVLIPVPAGPFRMGSNNGSQDERPIHQVTLAEYWIDKTEVTNQMYKVCVQSGACEEPTNLKYYSKDNYPVVYVNWYNAEAYCEWAGRRLPTEAQWEKAARGSSESILPWEGALDCLHANFGGCTGELKAVGSYPEGISPYGALDMLGNVWEWVYDKFDQDYYVQSPSEDPAGPISGKHHILRGAAWDTTDPKSLRITFRYNRDPNSTGSSYGFRCATSVSP